MAGCSRPLVPVEKQEIPEQVQTFTKEKKNMLVVGKPAPLFKAPAFFYQGKFTEISLEDYKGQWVMLCFYPGDFTFV